MFPSCVCAVCKLNVHKRCAKNVANNCGINTKDMAKVLQELGISGDKFSTASKRKKVNYHHYYQRVKSIAQFRKSESECKKTK